MLRLLMDPVVGLFFLGRLSSVVGIWVHNVAAAILVFDLTRSAAFVGAVSVAQFGPQLLLAPWTGSRADRGNRRLQLIAGRVLAAASSGGLALWITTHGVEGTRGAWAVIIAALFVGIGFAVGGPAMHALIPSMVRPEELTSAIALNSLPMTIARAGGPAAGALLATLGGSALAFVVVATTQLLFAGILATLRLDSPRRKGAGDSSLRGGLRFIQRDRAITAALLGTAAVGLGADPVITLTPSISQQLGAGTALVGALASAFGVGAGIALLPLGWLRQRHGLPRVGTLGLLMLASGLALLALAPSPATAMLALGLGGVGMTFALTAMTTVVQQRSPEELRGRVMALWSIAFIGSRPLAAAVNGAVADAFSVVTALIGVVLLILACAWLSRPSRVQPDGRRPGR
jgi:MFS family permease